jgi:DNA-binding FadR family transcriptional regulator
LSTTHPFPIDMPLQAIAPRRLYRQIAEQLRTLIAGGEFAPGSRLPPERDLAAKLGVSRPSVREALIALEVQGLVEVRMGSGIYVTGQTPARPLRETESELGPFEILRARQLIESELAALAARRKPLAALKQMRAALKSMEDDIAQAKMPYRGDRAFHVALAEASDNAALVRVVADLWDERKNPVFDQLGRHFESTRSWRLAVAEHRDIIRAVAAGEVAAARAAMRRHLGNSHDRFTAKWVDAAPTAEAA